MGGNVAHMGEMSRA